MDKICYIFAGINGAGKTTLYNMNQDRNLGTRVNIDEILHDSKGDWRNENDQKEALVKSFRLIEDCIKEGKIFNYETVFTKGAESFIDNIKKHGYKIILHYIGLDNCNIAIERVKNRELKGGHGIPEEDIKRRYEDTLMTFKKVIEKCDEIYVYDNSEKMSYVAFGENGKIDKILNNVKWFERLNVK